MTRPLLELALVGTRARGFHHDVASKLQMLMMVTDELAEYSDELDDEHVKQLAASALDAVKDVHQLMIGYRAMSRPDGATPVKLSDLFERGAARAAVEMRGTLPSEMVMARVPIAVQAVTLACEIVAGHGVIEASASIGEDGVRVVLEAETRVGDAPDLAHDDAFALIAFALGAPVEYSERRMVLRLPRAE